MVSGFVEGALSFDAAVTRSAIAMGLASDEADDLRDAVEALAQSEEGSIFPSTQIAEAFRAISDEGRGLEGTLSILESAMDLATATGEDLAQTTLNVEDVMSAFDLKVGDAARIVDVLNSTMKETGAGVGVVSSDLIQMGQVFTGLNMSIEESAAIIGVLRDRGIQNIQGLLTGYQQLAAGLGRGAELLEQFGVSATESTGKLKPMTQLFAELSDEGATAEDMFLAFGQRSATAMSAVINALDEVRSTAEANFAATGTAAEDAAQFMDSDAAAAQEFEASMADLKDELAKGLLPAITDIIRALEPLLDFLTEYPEIIILVVGAFVAYEIALVAYTISQWAANVAAWAFPAFALVAGIIAVIAVIFLLIKHWDEVTAAVSTAGDAIKGGLLHILELAKQGVQAVSDSILDALNIADKMFDMGQDLIKAFIDGMAQAFDDAKDMVGGIAEDISKFFGGSLPEVGALREIHDMGQDLMVAYVEGMQAADVSAQIGLVAQSLGAQPSVGEISPTASAGGGNTTINNNFTVDPEEFVRMISNIQRDQILTDRGAAGAL